MDAPGDIPARGVRNTDARTPVAEQAGILPDTGAGAATLALLAGGVAAAGAGTVLVRRSRA